MTKVIYLFSWVVKYYTGLLQSGKYTYFWERETIEICKTDECRCTAEHNIKEINWIIYMLQIKTENNVNVVVNCLKTYINTVINFAYEVYFNI